MNSSTISQINKLSRRDRIGISDLKSEGWNFLKFEKVKKNNKEKE